MSDDETDAGSVLQQASRQRSLSEGDEFPFRGSKRRRAEENTTTDNRDPGNVTDVFSGKDINLNVKFERVKPPTDDHLKGKKVKYLISKYIDENRDLYFVKLVSGALKRRTFESLIDVEDESTFSGFVGKASNVRIKYTYCVELLHAWATAIEKVKKMIEPSVIMTDRSWTDSQTLHERIIEKDGVLIAFARYVAFIMMTESNNLIPRNRTRYVMSDQDRIEDTRVLDLMRGVKQDLGVLRSDLEKIYLTPTR
jgi:hypothetical protein